MNRKARKSYFRNKLEENCGKPKAFWDILRLVLPSKKNSTEIDKLVVNGEELSDKHDIANSLNEYFTTIASTLLTDGQSQGNSINLQEENKRVASSKSFNFRAISEDDVFNALRTMDISKATGADIPRSYIGKQNGLISNHKKCEGMLIGSRYTVKNRRKLQVILDGNLMKQTEHFKDLGGYVGNFLTWNKHVTYMLSIGYIQN